MNANIGDRFKHTADTVLKGSIWNVISFVDSEYFKAFQVRCEVSKGFYKVGDYAYYTQTILFKHFRKLN